MNSRKWSHMSAMIRAEVQGSADQDRAEGVSARSCPGAAMVTATSEGMNWIATMSMASAWVGLTLPGMIVGPASWTGG